MSSHLLGRRDLFRTGLVLGAAGLMAPGAFAELLMRTPSLTEGPFYPDKLPLDMDNDLIIVNDSLTPAIGEITHLTGRVLDITGAPIKDAVVEIWQCDAKQVYLHSAEAGKTRDKNFQGFGKFTTSSKGEYRFRTIKPVPYPGRPAPHIHIKVKRNDRAVLTTQLLIRGHAGNNRDGVSSSVRDLIDRELIMTDFTPIKGSKVGELAAAFDIVIGKTPDERELQQKRPG